MLLHQIVAILDAELDRLAQLRTVISGLSGPTANALVQEVAAVADATETATEEIKAPTTTRAPRQPRARRAAKPHKTVPPALAKSAPALSGPIPNAPVVVRREALATEQTRRAELRERTEAAKKESPIGSLGAMIRALRPEATS